MLAHMLPDMLSISESKTAQAQGRGVALYDGPFVDDSKDEQGGVEFVGYGIWFGGGDPRNEQAPISVHERQSITRAEFSANPHYVLDLLARHCGIIVALDSSEP